MSAHSRNKGAAGEREVARLLEEQLGITFKRDLDQYREGERGDLLPSDPAFPFVIEVKRRASGTTPARAWWEQVDDAAEAAGKHPALFYRFDRQFWRVRLTMLAVSNASGADMISADGLWFETDVEGFCFIAREIMARRNDEVRG